MLGRDLPFPAAVVPADDGDGFEASDRLFSRDRCDHGSAQPGPRSRRGRLGPHHRPRVRPPRAPAHQDHRLGVRRLRPRRAHDPARAPGSAALHLVRHRLAIRRCVSTPCWPTPPATWPAEQVADLAVAVFHEFVSLSIQHLVNEIGERMLQRWPQLAEVSFDAQNRLWDLVAESSEDPRVKTYSDPRPPFGHIGLVLRRD